MSYIKARFPCAYALKIFSKQKADMKVNTKTDFKKKMIALREILYLFPPMHCQCYHWLWTSVAQKNIDVIKVFSDEKRIKFSLTIHKSIFTSHKNAIGLWERKWFSPDYKIQIYDYIKLTLTVQLVFLFFFFY